ncbi:biopolymer transporter ExbD [Myxococcota bacterium]|nr:biopolymer transporter ExbD [Myxococcota bacterium]
MAMNVGGKGLRSEINVTPLVDVMLVLLIIFMVITPMLQRGKPVPLPVVEKPEKQGDDGKDLVVSVEYAGGGNGTPFRANVYVGQTRVEWEALRTRLEGELRRDGSKEIFLKGDQRLDYGTVRKVMEICNEAGFGQVRLATEERKPTG